MQFKDESVKKEWEDERLKSDVRALVFALAGYCHGEFSDATFVITDVFYNKGQFNSQTDVHEQWRAVDIVLKRQTALEADMAMADATKWLNATFVFAVDMKPAVYHTTGQGWHIHVQVPKFCSISLKRMGV